MVTIIQQPRKCNFKSRCRWYDLYEKTKHNKTKQEKKRQRKKQNKTKIIRIKHACHVWSNLDTVEVFPCLSLVFLGALVLCRPLSANTVYWWIAVLFVHKKHHKIHVSELILLLKNYQYKVGLIVITLDHCKFVTFF